MASSENFVTVEQPWMFRQSFADSRVSDFYTKENETLTKALQMSFTGGVAAAAAAAADTEASLLVKPETVTFQTPTISGGSESEATGFETSDRRVDSEDYQTEIACDERCNDDVHNC
ncbi:calmodulin-binding protein 25-like [Abeliophyllum distichum]|uniref:Calmodulin-binding protein 25-like n=1 Tax=Abeliophyllum distichum TaxID=126358 RepID=A0ABD1VDJ7_9LAMI